MANPENRNAQRVGILAAASLAGLAGGTVLFAGATEYRRLEAERTAITTADNLKAPEFAKNQQIISGMRESLIFSAAGGVALLGSTVVILIGASFAISPRRRSDFT